MRWKIFLSTALIFFVTVASGCGGVIKSAGKSIGKTVQKVPRELKEEVAEQAVGVALDSATNGNNSPTNNRPAGSRPTAPRAAAAGKVGAVVTGSALVAEEILAENEHWIKDPNSDAYVWNPEPQDGESVRWNGAVVRDGNKLYAQGSGTLTWYRNGEVIQQDEGTFEHGKHHGRFKHTFKSGNIEYSNWNHGEEIADTAPDNVADAKQAFINYHKNITNGNYRAAYDILSNAQKQRVGNFDSYKAGFVDTISSDVTEIKLMTSDEDSCTFDYVLTARDRHRGGVKVQVFSGQVTMAKDGGRWYVRQAASQKISEHYE